MLFSEDVELFLPPKNSRKHGLRLIRELVAFESKGRKTNLDNALRSTFNLLKNRSVVFVISDLIDSQDFSKSLRILNSRHDVVMLHCFDFCELELPETPGFVVEDSETGELVEFSGSKHARERFAQKAKELMQKRKNCCKNAGVEVVEIASDREPLGAMVNFFRHRRRRR